MLTRIPNLLDEDQTKTFRARLAEAAWVDGRVTAGHQSALAKRNAQVPEGDPVARELGDFILGRLERHPRFISAALPLKVFPPLFNRYAGGQDFGVHVDNSIRQVPGSGEKVRTDLSATLFLSDPDEYDGGELVIEHAYGAEKVKLPAGHLVLYPASSLHRVTPVTRGARLASFFWIQSLVREDAVRANLFDMDVAIQSIARERPGDPGVVALTGVYHNLLRRFAETG